MTKREAILAKIKALMTGVTGVADASVFRSRVLAFNRDETPAIIIEPISDTAENSLIPYLTWQLVVRISIIVRAEIPDQTADAIVQSVHSKLTADLSLTGSAMNIEPMSVNFELLEADKPAGVVSLNYRVTYRTLVADLSN